MWVVPRVDPRGDRAEQAVRPVRPRADHRAGQQPDQPGGQLLPRAEGPDDAGKLTTNKMTEDVSQTFLGVRFNCNKCHDHPFERWTQTQYYQFGAFFARVAFKPGHAARRGDRLHQLHRRRGHAPQDAAWPMRADGPVRHASRTSSTPAYRQEAFADWMTSKDNPLFAKSYVNRVLELLLRPRDHRPGRRHPREQPAGEPGAARRADGGLRQERLRRAAPDADDRARAGRTSCRSTPNKWNEDDKINFSHAIPRRLTAEQMMDAVAIATGTKPKVPGLPDGHAQRLPRRRHGRRATTS